MQEHDALRNRVDQETPFPQSADEYFTHELGDPALLSVKEPPKARIEVHSNFKLLMAFFPFS